MTGTLLRTGCFSKIDVNPKKQIGQGCCQEAYSNIQIIAAISGKCWSLPTSAADICNITCKVCGQKEEPLGYIVYKYLSIFYVMIDSYPKKSNSTINLNKI